VFPFVAQYDMPIGNPQAEAEYVSGVWRRSFEHVDVTFDTATNTSTIKIRGRDGRDVTTVVT
jgi:hypothetical protein